LNLRRQAAARKLPNVPGRDLPQLVGPRIPMGLTAAEIGGGSPLKVKAKVIPLLAVLPEYADLSDDELVEMARRRTYGRLHVAGRWVAIALLLGPRDILPDHLK